MRPLVIQVVIVLVWGFLIQESKTNEVNLNQTCNVNFTSVNCFYNGTSTFNGFHWYTNGKRCATYSHFANGTCVPLGTKNCTGFTYTCPKNNASTMTVYDTMLYSDTEEKQILTCQPILKNSTNMSQTLDLKVHPRLHYKADIDEKISHKIDQNVKLWIKVVALPPPNFTWFQIIDGKRAMISARTNLKVVSKKLESNLTIFRILSSDGRTYMVRAENECGALEQHYHIKVEGDDDDNEYDESEMEEQDDDYDDNNDEEEEEEEDEKDSQLIDPMIVRIVAPVAVVVLLVAVAAVVIVCVRWKNGDQREANQQQSSTDPERTYQQLNHTNMGQSSIYNALELNVYANDDW